MFYENVAVNRGIQVKAFTDVDEARHWLEMRTRAAG
jgi:ClpP class serine protease